MPIITTVTSSLGIDNYGNEDTCDKEEDARLHQELIAGLKTMKLTGKAPKQVGGQFSFEIQTVQESVEKLMQIVQPSTELIILGSGKWNELSHQGPYNFRVINQVRHVAKDAAIIVLSNNRVDRYNFKHMIHPELYEYYNDPRLALNAIRELLVQKHKNPKRR